jgi:hypothetical protein
MDRIDRLQAHVDALEQQTQALEAQTHTVARQLRWRRGTAMLLLVLGLVSLPWQGANTQAQEEIGVQALTLAQRVAVLEAKLK